MILCGGDVTEPQYFEFLRSQLRSSGISVNVDSRGLSPSALVKEAVRLRDLEALHARRSGDRENVFDQTWVVTDVDDFGKDVAQAETLAKQGAINIAISDPCFELWLTWHVADRAGAITSKEIQRAAATLNVTDGKNHKSVRTAAVAGKYEAARSRAESARRMHARNGTTCPADNPSSGLDLLVASLLMAAERARPGTEYTL